MKKRRRYFFEKSIERTLLFFAGISVLAIIFITFFIFQRGVPLFRKVGIWEFLFTTYWEPTADPPGFGILSFIVASIYLTILALLFGVFIGIGCAIYLAEIAKGPFARILRGTVELLAGIPSVVYGFFGVVVISRMVREWFGGTGYSVLSGAIILAIMILPTVINISEVSIRAVPREYKEGSLAIGATHWQTIWRVLLPAARSGIVASVVLGAGRAIGETMAVLMVAGNAPIMPRGPLSKARTLTMNIVTDMGYASGDHMTSLFTTSIVLFLFIMILNISINVLARRGIDKK